MIPSADHQMAWIDEVLAFGVRRPGSPQDQAVADWSEARFRELGGRTAADLRAFRPPDN